MNKINKKDIMTRKKIIAYAKKIFFIRGFHKVSVDELCKNLNIGKATFYKHFKNREHLVEVVTGHVWREIEPKIWENLNSSKSITEIFITHFTIQLDILNSTLSTVFLADMQIHMPEIWNIYYETFRKKETAAIIELLKRGQKEGTIRTDIDSEIIVKISHAMMDLMATPNFLLTYELTPLEVQKFIDIIIRTLVKKNNNEILRKK